MRKIISLILAVLMLFSVMAVSVSAAEKEECGCSDHIAGAGCHCCLYCPEITWGYVTPCAYEYVGGKYQLKNEFCCSDCRGVLDNNYQCGCNCSCCVVNPDNTIGTSKAPIGGIFEKLWDEEAQQDFVNGFQAVLARISAVFDRIFDAIFEFLRLDEVLGNR